MSKPLWACSHCGMYSGRKEHVKRHLRSKLHPGKGQLIPFVMLIAGINPGIYQPFAGETRNFERTLYDRNLDTFNDEYIEELARKAARAPPQVNQGQPFAGPVPQLDNFFGDPENIFGLELDHCEKCLTIIPTLRTFIGGIEHQGSRRLPMSHFCSPPQTNDEINNLKDHLEASMPWALNDYVREWTNNQATLFAFRLPTMIPPCVKVIRRVEAKGREPRMMSLTLPLNQLPSFSLPVINGQGHTSFLSLVQTLDDSFRVVEGDHKMVPEAIRSLKRSTFGILNFIDENESVKDCFFLSICPAQSTIFPNGEIKWTDSVSPIDRGQPSSSSLNSGEAR
jgi:hypothetical protein